MEQKKLQDLTKPCSSGIIVLGTEAFDNLQSGHSLHDLLINVYLVSSLPIRSKKKIPEGTRTPLFLNKHKITLNS